MSTNNFDSRIPIYLQVIDTLKQQMALSILKPGDKLPSSRELAVQYSINPNTASRVYKEMELLGLCYTKRGLGTFVTNNKEIVDGIKDEMANTYVEQYVTAMSELGYTCIDMIQRIKEKEYFKTKKEK